MSDGAGLTAIPPPAPAAAATEPDRYATLQESYKAAGLDLERLKPETVSKAFLQLQKYGEMDIPKLVEARAKALAEERGRQAPQPKPKRAQEVDLGDADDDDDQDPTTLLRQLMAKVSALEEHKTTAEKQGRDLAEQDEITRIWAADYVAVQEQYPVLKDPDVDTAMRTVMAAHLRDTDDPRADKPGYVMQLAPRVLSILAKSGTALSRVLDEGGRLESVEAARAKKKPFDFAKATDEEYEEFLAQSL
jgi:hypothetical protein